MNNLQFFLMVSRVGDLVTTYLLTPSLRLELNPFVRLIGWRWNLALNFAAVLLLPKYAPAAALILMIASLMVAGWNLRNLLKKP